MELRELTFANMLREVADMYPDNPAIVYNNRIMTYRRLEEASDSFAYRLNLMGVKAGDHVALRADNCAQWFVALFGILKAGAIAVLIDGSMKTLDMMEPLKNIDAKYILHSLSLASASAAKLTSFLGLSEENACFIDRINTSPLNQEELKFVRQIVDDGTRDAVIIYTAGTIGKPRPVVLSQAGIVGNAKAAKLQLQSLQSNKLCLASPLHTIFALNVAMQYLSSGSTVYIPDSIQTGELIRFMDKNDVTGMAGCFDLYQAVLMHPAFVNKLSSSIHACYISNGFVTPILMMRAELSFKNAKFINGFGMVETSGLITTPVLSETLENRAISMGKVLPGIELVIYDSHRGVLSEGEVGEIVVRGPNIMKGYYNVPKEEQPIDEKGWLHTSDLGFIRGGKLYFTGRITDLIVRSGEKILPSEVERYIQNNPSVRNVKVMGAPHQVMGESVEACLILNPGYTFNEKEAREELRQQLSASKIPSHFFIYPEFPMTSVGKIDQNALKADVLNRLISEDIAKNLTKGILISRLVIKNSDYMIMPTVKMLEAIANELEFNHDEIDSIIHSSEEMLTERIMNAYGTGVGDITVEVILLARWLRLRFRDKGQEFELESSNSPSAKIIMNMVDNFVITKDSSGYPVFCLDFIYSDEFDVDAFLLEHSQNSSDLY